MLARDECVWKEMQILQILPHDAPSQGAMAKLCTYLQWFAWPDKVDMELYCEFAPSCDKAQVHS